MKLFELAKELDVKSKVLIDLLNESSDKKYVATSILDDEQIAFIRSEMDTAKKEEEKAEVKKVKTDADYRPDEMIKCHSVFPGILYFSGRHTGMTYTFVGAGDVRNVEYQDLKAAMLEHTESIFNPDIVIDDANLINDEHWMDVKHVYEEMYDEQDIKKLIALPLRDFKVAFPQLPIPTREAIITLFATQIENGTFEQLNKANYIDEVCGTRLDLKMH